MWFYRTLSNQLQRVTYLSFVKHIRIESWDVINEKNKYRYIAIGWNDSLNTGENLHHSMSVRSDRRSSYCTELNNSSVSTSKESNIITFHYIFMHREQELFWTTMASNQLYYQTYCVYQYHEGFHTPTLFT